MSKTVSQVLAGYAKVFETFGEDCPICGTPLLRKKGFNRDGFKMPGACKECGYCQPVKKHSKQEVDFEKAARKNEAYGFLTKFSVYDTAKQAGYKLSNFETNDPSQIKSMNSAKKIVNNWLAEKPMHAVMVGNTGSGKTHLSHGMLLEYLEKSYYHKRALFISFPRIISDYKRGMTEGLEDVFQGAQNALEKAGEADLLVIDDLGAERDTDFTNDIANDLMRTREDMPLVITTNLNAAQILDRYGQRFWSRLSSNMVAVKFESKDQRTMR